MPLESKTFGVNIRYLISDDVVEDYVDVEDYDDLKTMLMLMSAGAHDFELGG